MIQYNTDSDPQEMGVYACRVPSEKLAGLYEDKFLMWFGGYWSYPSSDQKYRGEVTGWAGPLQRKFSKVPGQP